MYKCLHYECFKTLTNNYYKTLLGDYDWIKFRWLFSRYKCTKHQFIHLLTATLKNSHIENSKNHKR